MAISTIFGLKLFRKSIFLTISSAKVKKDDNTEINSIVQIPNNLFLLKAKQFLDMLEITKKLVEYKKIISVLGGKFTLDINERIAYNNKSTSLDILTIHFY
jgi:hypothetical protein